MTRCASCLAGFSREAIIANCTCETGERGSVLERALRWIGEAHHHDGCNVRRQKKCSCGKEDLRDELIAYVQLVDRLTQGADGTVPRKPDHWPCTLGITDCDGACMDYANWLDSTVRCNLCGGDRHEGGVRFCPNYREFGEIPL